MSRGAAGELFGRLYRRLPIRYTDFLRFGAASSIAVLTLVTAAFAIPILDMTASEYGKSMLLVFPWMTLVGVAAEWTVGRRLDPVRVWLRGSRRAELAPAAWEAAVPGLAGAVLVGGSVVVVGSVPASLWVAAELDASGPTIAGAIVFVWAFVAAGGALHYLLWERALRPVVLDLASQLPAGFKSERRSLTLSGRLLMLIPVMNLISTLAAYSLASVLGGPTGRIVVGLTVAVLATALVCLPLTMMLRRSLLGPIDQLLKAMGRVERGDLEARLPVLSADEIGTVAQHFNSMLGGLHERERYAQQNVFLTEDLKTSRARLVAASDEARRRVERDLHDGAQQRLVLMNLKLNLLRKELQGSRSLRTVEEVADDLSSALEELRGLARGIYPQVLTSDGVVAALESVATEARTPIQVSGVGVGRYADEIEAAVYFCCLEALQNASKYAGKDASVQVKLAVTNGRLLFEVRDDGRGFDPAKAGSLSGLNNMTDRIGALGGEVDIESMPGAGTTVRGAIPVPSDPVPAI